jgi:hypothetical protein
MPIDPAVDAKRKLVGFGRLSFLGDCGRRSRNNIGMLVPITISPPPPSIILQVVMKDVHTYVYPNSGNIQLMVVIHSQTQKVGWFYAFHCCLELTLRGHCLVTLLVEPLWIFVVAQQQIITTSMAAISDRIVPEMTV